MCKAKIYRSYENYITSIKKKKFWLFIHRKRGNPRISGIMNYDSAVLNNYELMEAFVEYFSSVYTLPITLMQGEAVSNDFLISSFLLVDCAHIFIGPLHHIFNLILRRATFS